MLTVPSNPIELLGAVITPAVLILATSSIIQATATRQSRVLERMRKLRDQNQAPERARDDARTTRLLFLMARRALLLQRALFLLYLALSVFCITSISIALDALFGNQYGVAYLCVAMTGIAILISAAVILVLESLSAVKAVRIELLP